jgi:hypothetical protein
MIVKMYYCYYYYYYYYYWKAIIIQYPTSHLRNIFLLLYYVIDQYSGHFPSPYVRTIGKSPEN